MTTAAPAVAGAAVADDVELTREVYDAIPFDKCVVAGSFALYHYLKACGKTPEWKPNDVDIACKVGGARELKRLAGAFAQKLAGDVTAEAGPFRVEDRNGYTSDAIVAVGDVRVPGVSRKVQFVGVKEKFAKDAHEAQAMLADFPTGVSFTAVSYALPKYAKVFRGTTAALMYAHKTLPLPPGPRTEKWKARGW